MDKVIIINVKDNKTDIMVLFHPVIKKILSQESDANNNINPQYCQPVGIYKMAAVLAQYIYLKP